VLFPLFLIFGVGLIAASSYGRGSESPPRSPQARSGMLPPAMSTQGRMPAPARGRASVRSGCAQPPMIARTPIDDLDEAIQAGHIPSPGLVAAAVQAARAVGRHDVADAITCTFAPPHETPPWEVPMQGAHHGTSLDDVDTEIPPGMPSIVDALEPLEEEIEGAPAITVSGLSSPFPWVSNQDWASFSESLSRELPTYTAKKHVGRFRQRKERLDELGIDPSSIVDSPDAQADALARDLSDAYDRMQANGILEQCLGTVIRVPTPIGDPIEAQVTRSGVFGVVNAAGVENARSWLTHEEDRHRFPHTTDIFLRTNGMF
jgi:hypothetical protein